MKQVCWHSRRSKAYRGLSEARGQSEAHGDSNLILLLGSLSNFCGRRPLPFGGSHLRLPSGLAGIRTTTGSLSALAMVWQWDTVVPSGLANLLLFVKAAPVLAKKVTAESHFRSCKTLALDSKKWSSAVALKN